MKNPPQKTRASLLLRLKQGNDTDAWEAFVDIYSPLVFRYCRGRGLQPCDAADVTQEVLLRVYKVIERFDYDPKIGRFRSWLSTIVHNEIRRHSGKKRLPVAAPHEQEPGRDDSAWDERFQAHVLSTALKRIRGSFEGVTWTAFERTWMEMQDATEVATQLNISIDRVYVAKCRVLKKLRREVSLLADDGI